jgi:hypothetical protein
VKVSTTRMRPPQQGQILDEAGVSLGWGWRGWRVGVIGANLGVRIVGAAQGLLAVACGDELSQAIDVGGPSGAGQEAIVADAVEAAREDVQENIVRFR